MMSRFFQGVWRAAPLLLAAFVTFSFPATAASLPVSYYIDPTTPVYDLSGAYRFEQQAKGLDGVPVDLSLELALTQDARGLLRGSGPGSILVNGEPQEGLYQIRGRVWGGGHLTRARIVVRWKQESPAAGNPPFSVLMQYDLKATPGRLGGTVSGRARLGVLGLCRIHWGVEVPLPGGVDGSWRVQVDGVSGPSGTGTILLSNGRTLRAKLARHFIERQGVDQVKLAGTAADRGTVLNLKVVQHSDTPQSLSGRILGQNVMRTAATPSQFAGGRACIECHGPMHRAVLTTRHAQVGAECESCHGPAANHAANYYDPTVRPQTDLVGTACQQCHSGPEHPIFEEWSGSPHAVVTEDMNPANRISSCGRCHSGSVRLSLLKGDSLPAEANVPIGCVICHEPHSVTGNPAQLRNPLASTNDYSLTGAEFDSVYNPAINICGQCHNDRGASWTGSRPPHHSVQYNMLLGSVGELNAGEPDFQPAAHALWITNQCVGCHMSRRPAQGEGQPATTGHDFRVSSYNSCLECHPLPELLVQFVTGAVSNQVQEVKILLDYWATNSAPAELSAKYGVRAWEYSTPGDLSPGPSGPTASEQALIPVPIRKARFNLYLVLYDGSYGVHNGPYAITLLETARSWIEAELNQ